MNKINKMNKILLSLMSLCKFNNKKNKRFKNKMKVRCKIKSFVSFVYNNYEMIRKYQHFHAQKNISSIMPAFTIGH